MRLIDELERLAAAEESLFRRQLLREDLARLRKLHTIASEVENLDALKKAGMKLGWTQGDARTHELAAPLGALLEALHAYARGARDAAQEARLVEAWNVLHRERMEKLVGCLSTPVPRPAE